MRYLVTYTGSDVVRLDGVGVFQQGTTAWLSEDDACAAHARGDFLVEGLPIPIPIPVPPRPSLVEAARGIAEQAITARFVETREPKPKRTLAQKAMAAIRKR